MTRRAERFDCLLVLFCLVAVQAVLAAFTGQWAWADNPYNSYTLQALRWLKGHLDLGQNYSWLELAIFEGRYYVSFPPFPSYLLLPFAALFGESTPDGWIALLLSWVGGCYAVKLYRSLAGDHGSCVFFALFLLLGNGYLFLTMNGWVWFFAQNLCFVLSLAALYHAWHGQGGIALAAWACAVGCRPMTVLYLPILLLFLWRQETSPGRGFSLLIWAKRHWHWGIAPVSLAISYMALNWARFGNILEFGHNYLPEFTSVSTGQFSLSYLRQNLGLLFRLPVYQGSDQPMTFFIFETMAFYLIAPFSIACGAAWVHALLRHRKRERWTLLWLPALALVHLLILCCHKTLGGWQFGNRYLVDLLPWMFACFALWKPRSRRFDALCLPLAILGTAVNLVGSVAAYNMWI